MERRAKRPGGADDDGKRLRLPEEAGGGGVLRPRLGAGAKKERGSAI